MFIIWDCHGLPQKRVIVYAQQKSAGHRIVTTFPEAFSFGCESYEPPRP